MSEPTRVVTPRLEAALTETVRQLDDLIRLGEEVVREVPQRKPRERRARELELFKALRAELLEAFEEAKENK